jgi:GT2 family glycosyltransferase
MNMLKTSIVILTYNGERYLSQVLDMIAKQKLPPEEVVAIDSGSEDATLEILQNFRILTKQIPQCEFSHPRTRNVAARMCSGRFIVFLTQDATPADSCWLENLVRPFQEFDNVAATYSRQVPRTGSSLLEASDLKQNFGSKRNVKLLENPQALAPANIWRFIQFSNSSSAYDRDLLLKHPFAEQLEMAEDQEWAKRMLERGFAIVYEPVSVVVHSHDHNLSENYQRSLSMGTSFSNFLYPRLGKRSAVWEIGAWLFHIYQDFRYLMTSTHPFTQKCKWMLLSPIHRAATHYAFRKGWNFYEKFNDSTVSLQKRGVV